MKYFVCIILLGKVTSSYRCKIHAVQYTNPHVCIIDNTKIEIHLSIYILIYKMLIEYYHLMCLYKI